MQDILRAFPTILKHLDTEGNAVEPIVFAAWRRVVDGALAEHIVPLRLEKNRLIAAVSSETWRRQVADLGPALAERVNAAIGAQVVNYVEFQVEASVIRRHRRQLKASEKIDSEWASLAEGQLTPGLRHAADSIADNELRDKFLAAATNSLARRETDLKKNAEARA